jgi:hypothetical protein
MPDASCWSRFVRTDVRTMLARDTIHAPPRVGHSGEYVPRGNAPRNSRRLSTERNYEKHQIQPIPTVDLLCHKLAYGFNIHLRSAQ